MEMMKWSMDGLLSYTRRRTLGDPSPMMGGRQWHDLLGRAEEVFDDDET
jgi:hypothetical protein